MTDNIIDFAKLRQLEKLRLRREFEENSKLQYAQPCDGFITGNDKTPMLTSDEDKSEFRDEDSIRQVVKNKGILLEKSCQFCISSSFSDVYYVEDFLCEQFSDQIVTWLNSLPFLNEGAFTDPSAFHGKWTRLKHSKRNVALFDLNISSHPILRKLLDSLIDIHAFPSSHLPNHVLVNEYQGHEGIMPHTDGPNYFPRTATFSIGPGSVLFSFTPRKEPNSEPVFQVKLNGRSLILFCDDAYTNYCHGINDRVESLEEFAHHTCTNANEGDTVTRGYRLSLTFRHKYNNHV